MSAFLCIGEFDGCQPFHVTIDAASGHAAAFRAMREHGGSADQWRVEACDLAHAITYTKLREALNHNGDAEFWRRLGGSLRKAAAM